MRNLEKSAALRQAVDAEGLPVTIAALDVTSDESVAACFAAIEGRVEALVNNAGIEYHGSVEEMPVSQMAEIMNTNYLGAVRCIQKVLPGMRETCDRFHLPAGATLCRAVSSLFGESGAARRYGGDCAGNPGERDVEGAASVRSGCWGVDRNARGFDG
jgi:NAD(P)-dependent dehydrogenase (short-subunit alcohol dehydrogenase family)